MDLVDIKEISRLVLTKLIQQSSTRPTPEFGFPYQSMALHCGLGFEKSSSYFAKIEDITDKQHLLAMGRLLIDIHRLDWMILSMDAVVSQDPDDASRFDVAPRMFLPLNRFNPNPNRFGLISIGMTADGERVMLQSLKDGNDAYLPIEEVSMGDNLSNDPLMFFPPSKELHAMIDSLRENEEVMYLLKEMPFDYTRFASCV